MKRYRPTIKEVDELRSALWNLRSRFYNVSATSARYGYEHATEILVKYPPRTKHNKFQTIADY